MKVSILVLTINRFDVTPKYVSMSLRRAGYDNYDLCITDNGSSDQRIVDWGMSLNPALYIANKENQGTTPALNKMMALNPSDAYVFLGNDIEMPDGWLDAFVKVAQAFPDAGMIGIDWRNSTHTCRVIESNGAKAYCDLPDHRVFGTTFIAQNAINRIGSFCEDYGVYGLWDSDCAIRCHLAGLHNLYVFGLRSHHRGNDVGEDSDYRRMKDASIRKAGPVFLANVERYKNTGNVFIPNKYERNN